MKYEISKIRAENRNYHKKKKIKSLKGIKRLFLLHSTKQSLLLLLLLFLSLYVLLWLIHCLFTIHLTGSTTHLLWHTVRIVSHSSTKHREIRSYAEPVSWSLQLLGPDRVSGDSILETSYSVQRSFVSCPSWIRYICLCDGLTENITQNMTFFVGKIRLSVHVVVEGISSLFKGWASCTASRIGSATEAVRIFNLALSSSEILTSEARFAPS